VTEALEPAAARADDSRNVDKVEAREVLAAELATLRRLSYQQLVERLLDRVEATEVMGVSGARYQVEIQALWDAPDRPNDVLRVLGGVDDGSWKAAFSPLTDGFLVAPDGSFVGE
jgi:hypothetical protein